MVALVAGMGTRRKSMVKKDPMGPVTLALVRAPTMTAPVLRSTCKAE